MYQTGIVKLLATVLLLLSSQVLAAASKVNLAREAVAVSGSVAESAGTIGLINDGAQGSWTAYWSSWHGTDYYGEYAYVEFTWDRYQELLQSVVYWAEDGDSILLPTDAYLAWWTATNGRRAIAWLRQVVRPSVRRPMIRLW